MFRYCVLGVCGVLAVAPSASATVNGVITSRRFAATTALFNYNQSTGNSAVQLNDGGHFSDERLSALNYQVSAKIRPTDIAFGTNATALGGFSSISAKTVVSVTYTNSGRVAVIPTLSSEIIPGGFGAYVADAAQNPTNNGQSAAPPTDINQTPQTTSPATFNTFSSSGRVSTADPNLLASASFTFNISSDGVLIQTYTGLLTVDSNPSGAPITVLTLGGLSSTLKNFAAVAPAGSQAAYGFEWDATDILVPLGGLLAPGDSRTLTYSTEVDAITQAAVPSPYPYPNNDQVQAFSGFGDPIGRSTGGGNAIPFGGTGGFKNLKFSRYSIGLPTFDSSTGLLSMPVSSTTLPSLPLRDMISTVPEPETWALMLIGLAGVGIALRRRTATTVDG